ncbi:MarR family winged helix-turn-helix transcriptional regulator [Dactylosporangium sp. CA-092794]|uniref:MarR family winged helix-turn-helix transcriptional regulator n=1 Tax=Dactylosporangium sp. CA-092794 TaxID=3239929 RepID=UPI003D94EB76
MTDPNWLDERQQRAWRGYLALHAEVQRRVARQLLRETGLTSAEYAVLASLSEAPSGRLRVFQLRHAAEWEKTRLTHQITRMTARGLVAREPCEDDPRGAFVVLTEAGWDAVTAAAPRHVAHVRNWFFDALRPEQIEALVDISQSVLSRLPEADRLMGQPCPPPDSSFPAAELAVMAGFAADSASCGVADPDGGPCGTTDPGSEICGTETDISDISKISESCASAPCGGDDDGCRETLS